MRKLNIFLTLCLIFTLPFIASSKLKIGDHANNLDVKMKDISGVEISLNDIKKENGLVVIFSANRCPFVLAWENRFPEIKSVADNNNVGMVVVNANHKNRDSSDSFENMKSHASDKGYNFYYVVDDKSVLANSLGGQTTPHAFVFDKDMRLVYKGAIDDNYKHAAEVEKAYVKDAVKAIANGQEVSVKETKPMGCSIKRFIE